MALNKIQVARNGVTPNRFRLVHVFCSAPAICEGTGMCFFEPKQRQATISRELIKVD